MQKNNKIFLGIALILVGSIFLLGRTFDMDNFIMLLISIVAGGLYIYYGYNKKYRNVIYLIIALFVLFGQICEWFDGKPFFYLNEDLYTTLIPATNFLLIFIIHTYWFKFSSTFKRYWPLMAAGVLYISSAIIYIDTLDVELADTLHSIIWPAVIIIAGIVMVLQGMVFKKKSNQ